MRCFSFFFSFYKRKYIAAAFAFWQKYLGRTLLIASNKYFLTGDSICWSWRNMSWQVYVFINLQKWMKVMSICLCCCVISNQGIMILCLKKKMFKRSNRLVIMNQLQYDNLICTLFPDYLLWFQNFFLLSSCGVVLFWVCVVGFLVLFFLSILVTSALKGILSKDSVLYFFTVLPKEYYIAPGLSLCNAFEQ